MPALTPDLASWVVPSVLGVLAMLLSGVLVTMLHRRRLAEIVTLEEVEAEIPLQPEGRDVRVLQRQVEVLTRTLAEWDEERRRADEPGSAQAAELPAAPAAAPADAAVSDPVVPTGPAPVAAPAQGPTPVGPPTAYVALSRELAAAGDAAGAVLAQWVADLQVLRPALGGHGPALARAVAVVRHDDPVLALRACREAALGLIRSAGSVRALLSPLDHLVDLPSGPVPAEVPAPLVDLMPAAQAERLRAASRTNGMTA